VAFDLNRGWRLNPAVSVRPESFGALIYHFGNRRCLAAKFVPVGLLVTRAAP
jgi:mycofactocin biosynthesis protein MftB